ncbi:MAG TPA: hypothetical protein VE175_05785 [Woeseiaceae bacterium]|nr:hypothetical protein [Woeseiaceae bacterium]
MLYKIVAKLDRSTPPGEYRATLASTEGETPVQLHVEPCVRLGLFPGNLIFHGNAGSKPEAHLLLVNKGNVPLEIPDAVTVSMCNDKGLEKAYTSALLTKSNDLNTLFSHFIDRLRATHGGLLTLTFLDGSGSLEPGQRRAAVIKADFSPRLAGGESYHGLLTLHSASQIVSAIVTS